MNPMDIVDHFNMTPHPEGGFYKETYRSTGVLSQACLPADYQGERCFSTAILFLLRQGEYSRLHRIRQDEVWHWHMGGALRLASLSPDGEQTVRLLGCDIFQGQTVQQAILGGHWFGATPAPGSAFVLVSCTVAPGFDFNDFEMARRDDLVQRFPAAHTLINEFC